MASSPIISWQIDGETVADFFWRGLQNHCRWWLQKHEMKRSLLLGRKVMTKIDSILKSRDITLSTKVHLVKAMVFPVVMYGCESWTIKKAERRSFWTVVLEKTLESPREIQPVNLKGDQSWIFFGRTDAEAETPILWPPDVKNWLIGKESEGKGDDRGWDGWMASLSWWTWVWVALRNWCLTGKPGVLQSMGLQGIGHDWAIEQNCTVC